MLPIFERCFTQAKWACPFRLPHLTEQKLDGKGLESDPLFTLAHPSFPKRQSKTCFIFSWQGQKSWDAGEDQHTFSLRLGREAALLQLQGLCCFHCSSSTEINPLIGNCSLERSSRRVAATAVAKELCSGDPAAWTWILETTEIGKTPRPPQAVRKYAHVGEVFDYCIRKLQGMGNNSQQNV